MALPLSGAFCAALTPLNDDLSPDTPAHIDHCKAMLAEGCTGVGPLGTTGEATSFSQRERVSVLEGLVKGGLHPDQLLPGTGAAAYTDATELTRHALALGCTTVLVVPPFFYKGLGDDGYFDYYRRIVEGVADDRLRIVLYNIPQYSAVPLSLSLIARLRQAFPGVFVGIKDSSGDFANMSSLVDRFPGFAVFGGAEHLVHALLHWGGAGCITGNANLVARELAFICRHYADPQKADAVMAVQKRVAAVRAALMRHPHMPAMKAVLARNSGRAGWRNVRPPFTAAASAEAIAALQQEIGGILGERPGANA